MKKRLFFLIVYTFLLISSQCQFVFASQGPILFQTEGKYGYVDDFGEEIIPPVYMSATPFSEEGIAIVSQDVANNGWPYEYGAIDQGGNEVIPFIYQQINPFSQGFALAQKDGKFGYLAPDGSVVVEFKFEEASDFTANKAVVKQNGEVMVINLPQWEPVSLFLSPVEYVVFNSPEECLTYLDDQLGASDTSLLSEADYDAIEKLLATACAKMPTLEGKVQGNSIMILTEEYPIILDYSQEMLYKWKQLWETHNLRVTATVQQYFNLLQQGACNVVYEGMTMDTSGQLVYEVVSFPIPYFDPDIYETYFTLSDFNDYFLRRLEAMGNQPQNNSGATSMVTFINYVFSCNPALELNGWWNKVELGDAGQMDFFQQAFDLTTNFTSELAQSNIKLAHDLSNVVHISVDKVKLNKPILFEIHGNYLQNYLGVLGGLRIFIGDQGHSVYLSGNELKYIFQDRDILTFELDFSVEDTVNITFFEPDGKTVAATIPACIYFSLPETNQTASIFPTIPNQKSANWGGMISENNTIEFATIYSGSYAIRDGAQTISDISHLDEETQEKIHYMVSKGFFKLSGTEFLPNNTITRLDLVSALVKLFFVQDSNATSSFNDVSPQVTDYDLISAAYQAGIASGYDDNTFRGSNLTSRTEIIIFMARSLETRKGYKNVEDPTTVLAKLYDGDTVPEWAIDNVALAVEYGFIDSLGGFRGGEEISRLEVLELLYLLFFKLYDESFYNMEFSGVKFIQEKEPIQVSAAIPIFFILLCAFLVSFKKYRVRVEEERQFYERMELQQQKQRIQNRQKNQAIQKEKVSAIVKEKSYESKPKPKPTKSRAVLKKQPETPGEDLYDVEDEEDFLGY